MNPEASTARSPSPRKKWLHYQRLEKLKDFSLIIPAFVLMGTFSFYPLVYSFYLSFTDWNFVRPVKNFIGLSNYEKLLVDAQFYNVLKITFLYTVLDVSLVILIGLLLAMLFNSNSKLFGFMRFFIFMPHYISMVVASLVFMWLLNYRYGLLNVALGAVGVEPVNWLNNPVSALWSLVFVAVWKGCGFCMIIFIGGLRGIPLEYYESAGMDGAGRWHQFRHITLPLLSPITLFLVITTFIGAMQVFQSVDVMTGGGPLDSTRVMVMWIYEVAFKQFRIGKSSALVIIFFAIIVAFSFLQYYISKKRVHYEG
ncbi:carbohydrate ABC transporter permease [Paenibacillus allorhizosphaerae]|uniref:Melibiose/raffinose/stachyose import permease protein MelD n=1 Tax=Paenibacillus allorhizosphaerae TaxID=2849866 RepID=A0ABM8VR13_9BACL|nr:sugar ABC transporter permease [Paenibacillus allorhizosphaerae]CAG7654647.1 Melibiose/raffinose/stachyose import permease protein MelD [Paenibacillus allorhizosphaerae]